MKHMTKNRKIFLIIIILIAVSGELLMAVSNALDRSNFFRGLGAMVLGVFALPFILGLTWGIFEALDARSPKSWLESTLRVLAIVLAHSIFMPAILVLTSENGLSPGYFLKQYPEDLSSSIAPTLLIGIITYIVVYLVTYLIKYIIKSNDKNWKIAVNLVALLLYVFLIIFAMFFSAVDEKNNLTFIIFSCVANFIVILRRLLSGKPLLDGIFSALALSVGCVMVFCVGTLIQYTEPFYGIERVFVLLPITIAATLLLYLGKYLLDRFGRG